MLSDSETSANQGQKRCVFSAFLAWYKQILRQRLSMTTFFSGGVLLNDSEE
jgi:hypothetical protein